MLMLYHGANSVCSIKVRLVLNEKQLDWQGRHIDLPKGEQFSEAFLAVNPRAIVPVLDHDGRLIHESSVICEYLDGLSVHNPLMPDDPVARARTRTWGVYTLEYHDSVNTLTFSSYQRRMLLAKPAEELEARWRSIPDPIKARKLQDLVANGAVGLCASSPWQAGTDVRRNGFGPVQRTMVDGGRLFTGRCIGNALFLSHRLSWPVRPVGNTISAHHRLVQACTVTPVAG